MNNSPLAFGKLMKREMNRRQFKELTLTDGFVAFKSIRHTVNVWTSLHLQKKNVLKSLTKGVDEKKNSLKDGGVMSLNFLLFFHSSIMFTNRNIPYVVSWVQIERFSIRKTNRVLILDAIVPNSRILVQLFQNAITLKEIFPSVLESNAHISQFGMAYKPGTG